MSDEPEPEPYPVKYTLTSNVPVTENSTLNNYTLTAPNKPGYHFDGYVEYGKVISSANPFTLDIEADRTVNAQWTRYTVTGVGVTATANSDGSYTLTAPAKAGYRTDGVSVDGTAYGNGVKFTPTKNVSVSGRWTRYTVSVSGGKAVANSNGSWTVTANAPSDQFHIFTGWSNGVSSNPYTFTPTGNVSLSSNYGSNPDMPYFEDNPMSKVWHPVKSNPMPTKIHFHYMDWFGSRSQKWVGLTEENKVRIYNQSGSSNLNAFDSCYKIENGQLYVACYTNGEISKVKWYVTFEYN